MQPLHQIVGQERAVARHAIGHDGAAGVGETLGIAIGVDDDVGALPGQACQHAIENADAADRDARLVAAAHAAHQPAGQHQAEGGGGGLQRLRKPPAAS
jgi:hypothetical protein